MEISALHRRCGGPGYCHQFIPVELDWLRDQLKGSQAYVLFNNLSMYEDALAFRRLVEIG